MNSFSLVRFDSVTTKTRCQQVVPIICHLVQNVLQLFFEEKTMNRQELAAKSDISTISGAMEKRSKGDDSYKIAAEALSECSTTCDMEYE